MIFVENTILISTSKLLLHRNRTGTVGVWGENRTHCTTSEYILFLLYIRWRTQRLTATHFRTTFPHKNATIAANTTRLYYQQYFSWLMCFLFCLFCTSLRAFMKLFNSCRARVVLRLCRCCCFLHTAGLCLGFYLFVVFVCAKSMNWLAACAHLIMVGAVADESVSFAVFVG